MKVTPQAGLVDSITGPVGTLQFSRRPAGHSVRSAWAIAAPATPAQAVHRQALRDSRTLWLSIPAPLPLAWAHYVEPLGYSDYAGWNAYNIVALRDGPLTTLTPPNPLFAPVSDVAWTPGLIGRIDATWSYSGPGSTNSCSLYYRPSTVLAWEYSDTCDAEDEAASILGLEVGTAYEVALVPHDNGAATFQASAHDVVEPGAVAYEDFDTWTEYDEGNHISTDFVLCTVHEMPSDQNGWLLYDFGVDYFGPGTHHQFRWDPGFAQNGSSCCIWALSNVVNNVWHWLLNNSQAIDLHQSGLAGSLRLTLKSFENAQEHSYDDYASGVTYWLDVERTDATHLVCKTYTDEAMENLKHTHQVVTPADRSYRWAFACNSVPHGDPSYQSFTHRNLQIIAH